MTIRLAAALSLLALPLGACAAAAVGAAGATGIAAVQDRTIGEALDDAAISNEVKVRLNTQGEGLGEVDVEVANGLVLLSGRVMTPEQRIQAETIAWSVRNTRDVANEIRIAPPGGFLANVGDEITTARVRAALVGSSSVRSYNINVETYDGVVYLMGIARSADELKAAAEEASYVGGVKQVVSYIRIREPRPPVQGAPTVQRDVPPYRPPDQPAPADAPEADDSELLGGVY